MSETRTPYNAGGFVAALAREWGKGGTPILVTAADIYDAGRIAADELNAGLEDLVFLWPVDDYTAGKEPLATLHAGNARYNRVLRPAGEVGEAPPRPEFTLHLNRLELISLNRGLNCWLAELREKRATMKPEPGSELAETLNQSEAIAAEVCRRVDDLLGIR